jgi:two-component system, chemotaxis family, response regulator Rcp1
MGNPPLKILLLCDSPGDIRLIQEVFKDNEISNSLDVINNGGTALAYLRGEGDYHDAMQPHVIFMDLSWHFRHEFDVIKEITSDHSLHHIPIVALVSSDVERSLLEDLQVPVNDYITLPMTIKSLLTSLGLTLSAED